MWPCADVGELDDDAFLTTKGNHGSYCEIKRVKDIKDTAEIIEALGGLEVDLVRLGNAPRAPRPRLRSSARARQSRARPGPYIRRPLHRRAPSSRRARRGA